MRTVNLLCAFAALGAFLLGNNLEPALGALRDGAVHHESAVAADAHQVGTAGDHGHEDGGSAGGAHQHGAGHEHGTSSDHCTHAHGVAAPATADFEFVPALRAMTIATQPPHLSAVRFTESPPPRA